MKLEGGERLRTVRPAWQPQIQDCLGAHLQILNTQVSLYSLHVPTVEMLSVRNRRTNPDQC
jgi:hypothetical protein